MISECSQKLKSESSSPFGTSGFSLESNSMSGLSEKSDFSSFKVMFLSFGLVRSAMQLSILFSMFFIAKINSLSMVSLC